MYHERMCVDGCMPDALKNHVLILVSPLMTEALNFEEADFISFCKTIKQ
jgi:hypothetical protein